MGSIEYMINEDKRTGLFNVFHGDMNDPSEWKWVGGQFNTYEEAAQCAYALEQHDIGSFDLH